MSTDKVLNYIKSIIKNMPSDWLRLTTHRLDIYDESQAKTQFIDQFNTLYAKDDSRESALAALPTAYDYIRLGHPLSSVLEWGIANMKNVPAEQVISFDSSIVPILSILRKNLIDGKHTNLFFKGGIPKKFDAELIQKVYGYTFSHSKVESAENIPASADTNVLITLQNDICQFNTESNIDFHINVNEDFGSILLIPNEQNANYVADIQHVRRRETIAITPANAISALKVLVGESVFEIKDSKQAENKAKVVSSAQQITGTKSNALVASSGLSMQYAIMMGLIDDALEMHPGKEIKFIVPPNCYGGTNDQARRVAACIDKVEILDLPVDGGQDMNDGLERVLTEVALQNAIPYIIAEIPTNPRVEVPNLERLKNVLKKTRLTPSGEKAVDPVFILDQTFCPNVQFLGEGETLSESRAISYVSGSKFPSGGYCTAGYCVANTLAENLMEKIGRHLTLCDNEATPLQYEILAEQMPSMNQRIADAYKNTREFVNYIQDQLPSAKINFVPEELAQRGFTPSVFSLDLPTKGTTEEERETYKRALNLKLINRMIEQIPESKFCVSYGQLKGCYWTIPATSTQGTTKESDKDYIVRVALAPDLDLDKHKQVFSDFVHGIS